MSSADVAELSAPLLSLTLLLEGDGEQAAALLDGHADTAAAVPTSVLLVLAERYQAAAAVVEALLNDDTDPLTPGRTFYLALRSEIALWAGDWGGAETASTAAFRHAESTSQPTLQSYAASSRARLAAGRGQEATCRAFADIALSVAPARGGALEARALEALTLLHLGCGRVEAAASVGRQKGRLVSLRAGVDALEALVRIGDRRGAAQALRELADGAERTGRTWAAAAVARGFGLLEDDGRAEGHFAAAMALHARTPTPFEQARTELCYGEWLRRRRRPREAAGHLAAALASFADLGAGPWAGRARHELEATGSGESRASARPAKGGLTAQERRVADAVAAGASNKEVAAALYLSTKTVEFHLSSVYRKLGLTGRTQLARRVALTGSLP